MTQSLDALESRRAALLDQIRQLGDFRPGSITPTTGRRGNPNCRCHQPGEPGHGPNLLLTCKARGKTVTESFPSETARRKAQREIDEHRRWQQLSREFIEISTKICQRRPVDETLRPEGGKRPRRSSKKSPKKEIICCR